MKPWTVICLALLVAGARAQAEPAKDAVPREARLKIEADVEHCRGRQFGTHREAAQCINQAVQRVLISVDYPYMDLLQLVSAYRIACAQKMDSRELTQENCNNRMGQLRTRITAEEARRRNTDSAKGAGDVHPAAGPAAADYAALLKGIAGWSAAGGSARSDDIVCFQSGPMISCR